MRRRKALRIITLGIIGSTLAHPKSRKKIIQFGTKGFELYKETMLKISEKKDLSERERAILQLRMNFSSKAEEDEFVRDFLKDFQETRIRNQTFFKRKITDQELIKYIKKLSQKRREFAHDYLTKSSFEGKPFSRAEIGKELIFYFEENQRVHRVPSEKEIRDIVDNGVQYKFK